VTASAQSRERSISSLERCGIPPSRRPPPKGERKKRTRFGLVARGEASSRRWTAKHQRIKRKNKKKTHILLKQNPPISYWPKDELRRCYLEPFRFFCSSDDFIKKGHERATPVREHAVNLGPLQLNKGVQTKHKQLDNEKFEKKLRSNESKCSAHIQTWKKNHTETKKQTTTIKPSNMWFRQ